MASNPIVVTKSLIESGQPLFAYTCIDLVSGSYEYASQLPNPFGPEPLSAKGTILLGDPESGRVRWVDAQVLDHPPHRHRGVQAAAVGQHHLLRHSVPSVSRRLSLRRTRPGSQSSPARSRMRVSTDAPLPTAAITNKVSSPATVPSPSATG